ncbi:hypothetical protein scyTo_0013841 [Scyliorhinus torazame]|uniref:Uncharacterized protein n=1 Tax=Scyliorhinus torazame TaxID=75743 RepID=A0A401P5Z3_SCYTO|nr:hypothetical protein [Scyliorhinus torazame]
MGRWNRSAEFVFHTVPVSLLNWERRQVAAVHHYFVRLAAQPSILTLIQKYESLWASTAFCVIEETIQRSPRDREEDSTVSVS